MSNSPLDGQRNRILKSEEFNEVEFSLPEILQTLYEKRKNLVKFWIIGTTIGLLYAFLFNPSEYQTRAVILPVNNSVETGPSGLLKQFGKLGGLSLGGGASSEGIPAGLYPNVVNSTPFLIYLSDQFVFIEELDSSISIYDYFSHYHSNGFGGFLRSWTIELPDKLLSLIRGEGDVLAIQDSMGTKQPIQLSKKQASVINTLSDRITIELDEEVGTVQLNVKMPEPKMAAEIAITTLDYLMEYSIAFKTDKELDNQEFILARYKDAKSRFFEIQDKLAIFNDRNQNLTLARAQAEQQRLESEYNLAFNLYNGLSQQLEESRIKVQEKTPTFKILEPVQIPLTKSSPRKLFFILLFGIIGIAIGLLWSVYGGYLQNLLNQITTKNTEIG